MDFEEFDQVIERLRQNMHTDLEKLMLLTKVTEIYSELLEERNANDSLPKARKRPKKMSVDTVCPGPYWRTPEFIKALEPNVKKALSTKCDSREIPKYKGPDSTKGNICTTCIGRWKSDNKKLIQ